MSELFALANEAYDAFYQLYMKGKALTNIYVRSPYDLVEQNDPDYDGSYVHLETGHGLILEFEDTLCTFMPGNFSVGMVVEPKHAVRKKLFPLEDLYPAGCGKLVNFETKDHYFMEDFLPNEAPVGHYTGGDVNYLKHAHLLFEDGTNLHIHADYDDLWCNRVKED